MVPPSGVHLLETERPLLRLGSCGTFQYAICPQEGSVWQLICGPGDGLGRSRLSLCLASGEVSAEPTKIAESLVEYLARVAARGGRPPVVPFTNAGPSDGDVAAVRRTLRAEQPAGLHERWLASVRRMSALIESDDRFDGKPLELGPPLSEAGLRELEHRLGCAVPPALGAALTAIAGVARFWWSAETTAPGELREVDQGGSDVHGLWDVEQMVEMNAWVREDGVDDVLVFTGAEGNYIGIVVDDETDDAPVVFVDHEGGEFLLAPDFETFMTRWTSLGCPGTEFYCLRPFLDEGALVDDGIADLWRAWLFGSD